MKHKVKDVYFEIDKMTDQELDNQALEMTRRVMHDFPFSFFNILRSKFAKRLQDIIVANTSFLDRHFRPNVSTRCFYFINGLHEIARCQSPGCGRPYLKQISPADPPAAFYCCAKCAQRDPVVRHAIDRAKADHGTRTKDLLERTKARNRKLYGTDWFFQTDEFRSKTLAAWEKNGYSHPMRSDKIKHEMSGRYESSHGVRSPFQDPVVKEKTKAANRVKLGCDWPSQNAKLCRAKNQKAANTVKARFYEKIISNYSTAVPLFTKEEYVKAKKPYAKGDNATAEAEFRWKCRKCGKEFSQRMFKYPEPRCLACDPLIYQSTTSRFELEVREFVATTFGKMYDVAYRQPVNRSLISTPDGSERELDVVMLDKSTGKAVFALEADGIFFHSVSRKPAGYHLEKTVACEKIGVQLIHVWEDDWLNRREETTSVLKAFAEGRAQELMAKYESNGKLVLPRDRFGKAFVPDGWTLAGETPPAAVLRRESESKSPILVEDCGNLIYERTW